MLGESKIGLALTLSHQGRIGFPGEMRTGNEGVQSPASLSPQGSGIVFTMRSLEVENSWNWSVSVDHEARIRILVADSMWFI